MQAELVQPLAIFQQRVGAPAEHPRLPLRAPTTRTSMKRVREAGYIAALDVRRQGNPVVRSRRSRIHRSPDLFRDDAWKTSFET